MLEFALIITGCIAAHFFYTARISSTRREVKLLQQRISEEQACNTQLRQSLQAVSHEKERIATAYEKDKDFWEQKARSLENLEAKWKETFENITSKMLRSSEHNLTQKTETSLEHFRKHMRSSLDNQDAAFGKLEKSLKEGMVTLSTHITTLAKDQTTFSKTLQEHKELFLGAQHAFRAQTEKLLHALKTPQVRGQWGEIQLKRIVELSGMEPYCDFSTQKSVTTDDAGNTIRPDLLINLPENRHIVVDAKAPLGHYLEGMEIHDINERNKKMSLHAKQIWGHVTALSSKKYWDHFNSPDFVILFMPGEPFLSSALEHDPSLLERAANQSVVIATPTTLLALLKAVHYGWRNMRIAENIRHVLDVSTTLLQRADAFAQHFQKIGASLEATNSHFNKAVSSFETRLLPSARKLHKLGLTATEKDLSVQPIHEKPRSPRSTKQDI